MKVDAIAVPAVAGAAVVATALTMLGIGVAAGFDSEAYATATQKIWDGLSSATKQAIILTELAGTTVAHYTEQALRDIFAGAQATFAQNPTTNPVYTHAQSFDNRDDMIAFLSNLGVNDAYSLLFHTSWGEQNSFFIDHYNDISISNMTNFRYIGNYTVPDTNISTFTFDMPYNIKTEFRYDEKTKAYRYAYATLTGTIAASNYSGTKHMTMGSDKYTYHESSTIPLGTIFTALLFDVGSSTYITLISTNQSNVYTAVSASSALIDGGAIPTPGQDVFNPADAKFYADGMSTLNHKLDDVLNRLKERVGETGQISDMPDTTTIPGRMADQQVSDKTKAQDQATATGKEIATAEDKAANDATNVDRDTTKPSTDTPSTDIPDLSLPQIITKKFPFSIPWDLYRSVNILVAPAKAPRWELPVKVDLINVNTTLVIDLAQFDGIAALIRWGLSLLFCVSLIILSSSIIKR